MRRETARESEQVGCLGSWGGGEGSRRGGGTRREDLGDRVWRARAGLLGGTALTLPAGEIPRSRCPPECATGPGKRAVEVVYQR